MKTKLVYTALILLTSIITSCDVSTAQSKTSAAITNWDYDFANPDNKDVQGFYIYKKAISGTTATWERIGVVKAPATTFSLTYPYAGVYTVVAYNAYTESDPSNELTLVNKLTAPARFRTN
jgi:hypothetical protein